MHVHLIHLPLPGASGTKPGTNKTTVLDKSQNKSQNKSARRPSRIRAATKIDKYTFICVLSIKRVLFRVLSHVMFHVLFRLLSQTVNIFVPGFVPEGRYFCSRLLLQRALVLFQGAFVPNARNKHMGRLGPNCLALCMDSWTPSQNCSAVAVLFFSLPRRRDTYTILITLMLKNKNPTIVFFLFCSTGDLSH